MALVAFAIYPGGNAFAKQNSRIVPEMAQQPLPAAPVEVAKQNLVGNVPVFEAALSSFLLSSKFRVLSFSRFI